MGIDRGHGGREVEECDRSYVGCGYAGYWLFLVWGSWQGAHLIGWRCVEWQGVARGGGFHFFPSLR